MDEIQLQTLIKVKYSGAVEQVSSYFNLTIQAAAVLIAGIILWRASAILHKRKKAERKRNSFFETPYSKGWKR